MKKNLTLFVMSFERFTLTEMDYGNESKTTGNSYILDYTCSFQHKLPNL